MDMFDFACRMERDGEAFYRDLAKKCPNQGVAGALLLLADQEAGHVEIIEAIRDEQPAGAAPVVIGDKVKNVFQELAAQESSIDFGETSIDAYRRAQELETRSREFYTRQAEEQATPEARDIFLKLAAEENRHFQVLQSVIDLISKQDPGNWLENAEWYHSDDF